jgi:DNA-binding transcriptional regulator YiaG
MDKDQIKLTREALGLNQAQFGQLFGIHAMTVSRWESGITQPSPHEIALLIAFQTASESRDKKLTTDLKQLLVGAGIVAALLLLLSRAG